MSYFLEVHQKNSPGKSLTNAQKHGGGPCKARCVFSRSGEFAQEKKYQLVEKIVRWVLLEVWDEKSLC